MRARISTFALAERISAPVTASPPPRAERLARGRTQVPCAEPGSYPSRAAQSQSGAPAEESATDPLRGRQSSGLGERRADDREHGPFPHMTTLSRDDLRSQ